MCPKIRKITLIEIFVVFVKIFNISGVCLICKKKLLNKRNQCLKILKNDYFTQIQITYLKLNLSHVQKNVNFRIAGFKVQNADHNIMELHSDIT